VAYALLLDPDCISHLTAVVPDQELRCCSSWTDLDLALRSGLNVAVFDPSMCPSAPLGRDAVRLFVKYPNVTFIAYVRRTPENLHAVFRLSVKGLQYVFVHPIRATDRTFRNLLDRAQSTSLAVGIVDAVIEKAASLPTGIRQAVSDLMHRPDRYATANDLALEARVATKTLYHQFARANLNPPKELLIFAKTVHAYCYLQFAGQTPHAIAKRMGYADTRRFSRHVAKVLGCGLRDLRDGIPPDEALLRFLEWLNKPAHFRGGLGKKNWGENQGSSKHHAPSETVTKTIPFK